jgi:hypothetical protein
LIPISTTYDRIGFRAGASFSGTASMRLGIYNDNNGKPGTVNLDAGTVSVTTSGTNYEITINKTLSAGIYWLAANLVTAATTNNYVAISAVTSSFSFMSNYASLDWANVNAQIGFTESVNASSGFATAGTVTETNQILVVGLRGA